MAKTKAAALHEFFSSFGIPAYPVSSVPEDTVFPWLTYELAVGGWEEGEVSMTVNLWYYTESEAVPTLKAEEICHSIGIGGIPIPCDDGTIWIKLGSPRYQNLRDETDPKIKRRYMNITAEYLTIK